jgi:site-specific DNA recombinase
MSSTNGHGPRRAILYARVSTDEQARSGYSLAQQLEALRDFANREGYEVLEEVSDPGQSGASLERPGMDHIRDLVAAGGVSLVLAQDRDRFAREPAYLYLLRREFGEQGTKIRALNDRGDESPEGELTEGILDQLAKYERAKIAERTRRGLLRKAREGRLIGTANEKYGFRYNDQRDGFVVYEPEMLIVEKIFRLTAEGRGVRAIQTRLHREGMRTRKGGKIWARAVLQRLIFDDAYRAHTFEEIAELVSPTVASRLNSTKEYGVEWYNRHKVTTRTVSAPDPDNPSERIYKERQFRTTRPRDEWIAIPVPAYLPRALVEAARAASEANKGIERTRLARPWELRGVMRCSCGRSMGTHSIKGRTGTEYHYYQCSHRKMHASMSECSQKALRAENVEAAVWEYVYALMSDPETIRVGIDAMIDEECRSSGLRGNPDQEAKGWLERIADVDRQRARAQDLAVEGLLSPDELRAKLAELTDARSSAERELEALRGHRERIQRLERNRDALLEEFPAEAPERLEQLTGEQRNRLYRTLKLEVRPTKDGYEVMGPFCTLELTRSSGGWASAGSRPRSRRG